MGNAIVVESLGKQFRRYHPDRPVTLNETFLRGLRRLWPADRFWALRDVSFSVPAGRTVALIGANGSGKSTLLRLIAGVGRPSEGRAIAHGHVGALLDLGAGFHDDLTGRENVFTNGIVRGLTRREVRERFDAILTFAELQEFIDSPLRTYSSGMRMRLAFAVAVHVEPDVLLIDEVLSVGDISFQRKCLERIARFRSRGGTILLASHEMAVLRGHMRRRVMAACGTGRRLRFDPDGSRALRGRYGGRVGTAHAGGSAGESRRPAPAAYRRDQRELTLRGKTFAVGRDSAASPS